MHSCSASGADACACEETAKPPPPHQTTPHHTTPHQGAFWRSCLLLRKVWVRILWFEFVPGCGVVCNQAMVGLEMVAWLVVVTLGSGRALTRSAEPIGAGPTKSKCFRCGAPRGYGLTQARSRPPYPPPGWQPREQHPSREACTSVTGHCAHDV